MASDPAIIDAIRRAAEEDGVDPATALAYAQRESNFNPLAKNSKTIRGLYQMSGALRGEHAIGDTDDPYEQTKGFNRYFGDLKAKMAKRLGRDVTDTEAYAGHHFGAGRGARMFNMHPDTPVDQVFTPRELRENKHIVGAGTVGRLLGDVTGDIEKRRASFGSAAPQPLDFSSFEELSSPTTSAPPQQTAALDFSQFGEV